MKTSRLLIALSLSCTLNSSSTSLFAKARIGTLSTVYTNAVELNYSTISRLQRDKTTDREVKSMFGIPTVIDSDGQRTQWYYRVGKANLHIKFNTDHTVAAYEYKGSDFDAASKVNAQ